MIPNATPPNIPPAMAATFGEVLRLSSLVIELVCMEASVAVLLAPATLVRVTPPATKKGERGSEADVGASAEMPVPGVVIFTVVSSGCVRINASIFIELSNVPLVLVTVIVYVSVILSISLLNRTACARVS